MTEIAPVAEQSQTKKPSRLRRWSVRLLKIAAVVYVLIAVLIYFAQTWLIFPGRTSQGTRWAALDKPVKNSEMVHLTTRDGDKVVALFGPALASDGSVLPDTAHRPTVLFFYGNAST